MSRGNSQFTFTSQRKIDDSSKGAIPAVVVAGHQTPRSHPTRRHRTQERTQVQSNQQQLQQLSVSSNRTNAAKAAAAAAATKTKMATATTTTTALPRTHRTFNASAPPTGALPALPGSLTPRPSLSNLRKPNQFASGPITPARALPRPTSSIRTGTSTLTTPLSPPGTRSVSIAAFPQPPRGGAGIRIASMPPSPLVTAEGIPNTPAPASPGKKSIRRVSQMAPPKSPSGGSLNARFSRDSGGGGGGGEGGFLSSGTLAAPTDGLSPTLSSRSGTPPSTLQVTPIDTSVGNRSTAAEDKEGKGNIIVSVRVRPDGVDDQSNSSDWHVDGKHSTVGYRGRDGGTYEFDNVFTQVDDNSRVYDSCAKRLVRRVMEGYHGTVFAYGMTGTGKTFSMQGTTSSPGVIPLAITDIFSFIRETPHREFLLRVSYLEIYNERIHDLLASQPGTTGFVPLDQQTKGEEIKLREDPKRGVYATPLKEEIVQSPTQLLRVIARGDLARRTGSTQFNARSSRSHAVVQIVVESRDRVTGAAAMVDSRRGGPTGGVRVSTLSLIDLAGSERAAENKERRQEGAHINRSLLTLGTVIARLSKDGDKDKDGNHLPYRDSKLTRLLQPALSGNSLVSILCTIAIPASNLSGAAMATNIGETVNTLKFAARAKNNLTSHAKKSEESFIGGVDPGSRALLERYRNEITSLRAELENVKAREAEDLLEKQELVEQAARAATAERQGEQLLEIQLARTALKERIEHLNRLILCSKSSGVNSARSSLILPGHLSTISTASITSPTTTLRDSAITEASSTTSSATSDADGYATLSVQFRALQADLADKTRYISTLEKRLLQARRSSQSRTSIGITSNSPRSTFPPMSEDPYETELLREKDAEIAELKARLDDKERMVVALRSAARKRDIAETMVSRRISTMSTMSAVTTNGVMTEKERGEREREKEGLTVEGAGGQKGHGYSASFSHPASLMPGNGRKMSSGLGVRGMGNGNGLMMVPVEEGGSVSGTSSGVSSKRGSLKEKSGEERGERNSFGGTTIGNGRSRESLRESVLSGLRKGSRESIKEEVEGEARA